MGQLNLTSKYTPSDIGRKYTNLRKVRDWSSKDTEGVRGINSVETGRSKVTRSGLRVEDIAVWRPDQQGDSPVHCVLTRTERRVRERSKNTDIEFET